MAGYLGIDPDSEPGLLDIARMAVAAPVPSGWQQVDTPDGYAVFRSATCWHDELLYIHNMRLRLAPHAPSPGWHACQS